MQWYSGGGVIFRIYFCNAELGSSAKAATAAVCFLCF